MLTVYSLIPLFKGAECELEPIALAGIPHPTTVIPKDPEKCCLIEISKKDGRHRFYV